MPGRKNFDQSLKMRMSREQYYENKRKGGASGSSAGQPRPYARKNIRNARLWSPKTVGQILTVTPKHNFLGFRVGQFYEWEVVEPALGYIGGMLLKADKIAENFIVKSKGKQ